MIGFVFEEVYQRFDNLIDGWPSNKLIGPYNKCRAFNERPSRDKTDYRSESNLNDVSWQLNEASYDLPRWKRGLICRFELSSDEGNASALIGDGQSRAAVAVLADNAASVLDDIHIAVWKCAERDVARRGRGRH